MTSAILAPVHQIEITPGSAICIGGIDWAEYLTLIQQLGEDRSTRIAYNDSILEIRSGISGGNYGTINSVDRSSPHWYRFNGDSRGADFLQWLRF